MPGDPYKRARPGQPLQIPAAVYNDFLDTAAAFKAQRQGTQAAGAGRPLQPGQVLVKNTTGTNLDRFAVLGISDALISPADNANAFAERPMVQGVTPAAGHVGGRFVVLVEPIAAGKVGVAAAAGLTILKLNVTDANHQAADAKDGTTAAMVSVDSGPVQVLWKESGTGDGKWAIGRFGSPPAALPFPRPKYAPFQPIDDIGTTAFDFIRYG